jgi:hypothetical protein
VPLPLPMLIPTSGELGMPIWGTSTCAILRSGWTLTVTGTLILGCSRGGALGGFNCCGANLGGFPRVTGVGPFWPPPPPICTAFGGAFSGGGGGSRSVMTGGVAGAMRCTWRAMNQKISPMITACSTMAIPVEVGSRLTSILYSEPKTCCSGGGSGMGSGAPGLEGSELIVLCPQRLRPGQGMWKKSVACQT